MKVTFAIDKNFRKFKQDQNHELEIPENGILYLAGNNGCGKSTLLQILRSKMDSLHAINKANADGLTHQQIELTGMEPATVSGFDYDECFYLDAIIDDPISLENCATAWSFVSGGGLHSQHISRGEKSLMMIEKFRRTIRTYLEKKYGSLDEWKTSGKKGLIVLDEMDEGLDINLQVKWNTILYRIFIEEMGCSVVAVTHNPLCMMSPTVNETEIRVYHVGLRLGDMTPEIYFEVTTGYELSLKKMTND